MRDTLVAKLRGAVRLKVAPHFADDIHRLNAYSLEALNVVSEIPGMPSTRSMKARHLPRLLLPALQPASSVSAIRKAMNSNGLGTSWRESKP
jgi:hypothetical protein